MKTFTSFLLLFIGLLDAANASPAGSGDITQSIAMMNTFMTSSLDAAMVLFTIIGIAFFFNGLIGLKNYITNPRKSSAKKSVHFIVGGVLLANLNAIVDLFTDQILGGGSPVNSATLPSSPDFDGILWAVLMLLIMAAPFIGFLLHKFLKARPVEPGAEITLDKQKANAMESLIGVRDDLCMRLKLLLPQLLYDGRPKEIVDSTNSMISLVRRVGENTESRLELADNNDEISNIMGQFMAMADKAELHLAASESIIRPQIHVNL